MTAVDHYGNKPLPRTATKKTSVKQGPKRVLTLVEAINLIVNTVLPKLAKKIEAGKLRQKDIEGLRDRVLILASQPSLQQEELAATVKRIELLRTDVHQSTLLSFQNRLLRIAHELGIKKTVAPPAEKRSSKKASKGKLRIGSTDIDLEAVPVVCQTGARVTLTWDSNRKGIFVLAPPNSTLTVLPQGPNAIVLLVR